MSKEKKKKKKKVRHFASRPNAQIHPFREEFYEMRRVEIEKEMKEMIERGENPYA